jgi:hypothetical protein
MPATPEAHKPSDKVSTQKGDQVDNKVHAETQKKEDNKAQLSADAARHDKDAKGLNPVEIKSADGSSVKLNENGKVATITDKSGKKTEIGYDANGKINSFKDQTGNWTSKDGKTWTNEKGESKKFELSVTKDGTIRQASEDKIVYRKANGFEKVIEANGRITENGKETQPAFNADKLARLGKSVDAIAYACNGGLGIGTDKRTIEAELGDRSEAERLVMKRMWKENAAKGKSNYDSPTLEAEMRDELSGSDLDRVLNMINKRDGVADSAGRVHTALMERGEWSLFGRNGGICEKDIRDTLAKSTAKQIEEIDQDYRNRYGISLREAILKDKNISASTREAVDIYLKGNDKRTPEDVLKLTDIACKNHNIDMFQEAMRNAPQKARDQFLKDGGEEKMLRAFGEMNRYGTYTETADLRHARDYARYGKESTANIVSDNSGILNDHEDAIKHALKNMTPEERKLYALGRKLATGEGDVDTSKLTEADKKKANEFYKDLHGALANAADATEMREWEALITNNGKADFISNLASKRNIVGWNNVDDIVGTIEKMPKQDWERLKKESKEGKSTYRDEIVKTLGTYLSDADLKRCTDVLDKKIAAETFDQAQKTGKRDALTSMKDARGWFNNNEENLLNAIHTMSKEEQARYRNDEAYRKEVDKQVLLGLEYGKELDAARYMLDQIKQGKSPDTIAAKLRIHAQNFNTDEAQVVRDVEDEFNRNPELRRKVTNPQNDEERKISQDVKDALKSALGPLDYQKYGEPLVKNGKVSAELHQDLNKGLFDDDEQGSYKDLLRVSDAERQKILTNKDYADKLLEHLSESEREVALNNLREYDRVSRDKAMTPAQKKETMEAMVNGEMRPEDKLRSYMLGFGTNDDGIKEVLKDLTPEQAQKVREDYERKYGSLTADLNDELSGSELEGALDQVRVKGSQDEEFDYYRDHFYYNTRGFGREAVDEVWNGTGFQTDEAFNRYFNAISDANRDNLKLTAEQQKELQDSMKEAAEELQKSKAELANTAADIAITVAAFIPGGQAAALLRFGRMATIMGLGGGLTKVLLKTALLGEGYSWSNAGLDFAAGFSDGALNVVGGGHLGKILKVGDKAASKAACKTAEELAEKNLLRAGKMTKVLMEDGSEKLVSKNLLEASRSITSDAIAQGSKQFDDKAIKAAAKELVNHEVAEKATKDALARGLTKELAEKEGQKALVKAEEQISGVLEKQLQENLALETRSFARRFLSDVGANTFNGATGAGASGAISSLSQWDATRPLEENLQMVLTAAGTSALTGAVMGFGMSGLMKTGMEVLEGRVAKSAAQKVEKNAAHVDSNAAKKVEQASEYNPPISARVPEAHQREVAPAGAGSHIRNKGEKVLVNGNEWAWVQYDRQTGAAIVQRIEREQFVRVDVRLKPQEIRPVNIEGREFHVDNWGAVWQSKGEGFYSRVYKYQVVPVERVADPSVLNSTFEKLADWGKSRRQIVNTGDVKPVDMYGNAALVITGRGLPAEGVRMPLNESTVPVGRNHLPDSFDAANASVSTEHLKVSWDAKEQLYYMTDNSTNGTYVKRAGESQFKHYRKGEKIYMGPADEIRLARVDGPQVRLDLPQAQMYARPSQVPQNLDVQILVGGKKVGAQYGDVYILGRDFQNLGENDALNRQVAHYHGHVLWNSQKQTFEFVDLTSRKPGAVRAQRNMTVLVNDYSAGNGSYLIRDGQSHLIQKHGPIGDTVTLRDGDRIRLGSMDGPEVKIVLNDRANHMADGRIMFNRADNTVAVKRPDGTIKIENALSGSRVEDSTGRVLETTDIYGRNHRFHYDRNGRLNAAVTDDGTVLATNDGVHWIQTYRDGRTQSLGENGFSVDSDGSLKMHDPAKKETSIYRLDGVVEIVDSRGRVTYTEANPMLEKNRLLHHINRFDNQNQRFRFAGLMNQFEARCALANIPASEVALAYHHLNRILQAGDSAMLGEAQRLRLSEIVLNNMVFPDNIDQGAFPTCNVTVLEKRMYTRKPAEAVRLIADVVETGKYVTASGFTIDLSRVPQALAPDAQARQILNHTVDPYYARDLHQENVRNWGSQIFENTAANIKWLNDSNYRRNSDDVVLYEHVAGSNQEGRLVRYYVNERGLRLRDEIMEFNHESRRLELVTNPMVYASELNRVYNEIAGGVDNRFVIIGPTIPASHLDIHATNLEQFESALRELAEKRDFPAVIMVNTNNKIFNYVGGQHSWHVVNIQNVHWDKKRQQWMVEYTNQWGRSHDRMGDKAVTANELFAATIGPNGRPAASLDRSAAASLDRTAAAATPQGPVHVSETQLNANSVSGNELHPENATAVAMHNEGIRESSAVAWQSALERTKAHDPEGKKDLLELLKNQSPSNIRLMLVSPVTGQIDLAKYNLLKSALNETHLKRFGERDRARLIINLLDVTSDAELVRLIPSGVLKHFPDAEVERVLAKAQAILEPHHITNEIETIVKRSADDRIELSSIFGTIDSPEAAGAAIGDRLQYLHLAGINKEFDKLANKIQTTNGLTNLVPMRNRLGYGTTVIAFDNATDAQALAYLFRKQTGISVDVRVVKSMEDLQALANDNKLNGALVFGNVPNTAEFSEVRKAIETGSINGKNVKGEVVAKPLHTPEFIKEFNKDFNLLDAIAPRNASTQKDSLSWINVRDLANGASAEAREATRRADLIRLAETNLYFARQKELVRAKAIMHAKAVKHVSFADMAEGAERLHATLSDRVAPDKLIFITGLDKQGSNLLVNDIYRRVNNISASQFMTADEALAKIKALPADRRLDRYRFVFLDDAILSGGQGFDRAENLFNLVAAARGEKIHADAYVAAIGGYEGGLARLRARIARFAHVQAVVAEEYKSFQRQLGEAIENETFVVKRTSNTTREAIVSGPAAYENTGDPTGIVYPWQVPNNNGANVNELHKGHFALAGAHSELNMKKEQFQFAGSVTDNAGVVVDGTGLVFRGAAPTAVQLDQLAGDFNVILDLRASTNSERTGAKLAPEAVAQRLDKINQNRIANGMAPVQHHRLPLSTAEGKQVTQAEINSFIDTMNKLTAEGKRIYVHCERGCDRTGLMVALYEVSKGADPIEVFARMQAFGFNNTTLGHMRQILVDYANQLRTSKVA